MSRLFKRVWRVEVAGVDISELDISFNVVKTGKRQPNTAEVKVYNLSETNRKKIDSTEDARLVLRAGYFRENEDPPVLFVGDVMRSFTERDAETSFLTNISARDGGRAFLRARFSKSYGPGTLVSTVLRDVVEALGIGVGNFDEFDIYLTNGGNTFPDGYVASGWAHRVMNSIVRGAGLRWSVQNNSLQLMRRGRPLQTRAVRLSPSSGLIGSPTIDKKGVVTAVSLMQPGLEPGRRVVIESRLVEGEFEIRKTQYDGDTSGGPDWYATIEAKKP